MGVLVSLDAIPKTIQVVLFSRLLPPGRPGVAETEIAESPLSQKHDILLSLRALAWQSRQATRTTPAGIL